jgi:ribosome-associated protein
MSELKELIQKVLLEKQAKNMVVIDMTSVSPFTDYFIIVTANNLRHAGALCDYVQNAAAENGYDIRSVEGDSDSTWLLVDLYEVIVHIFTEETRQQYRLETLWADQPQEYITD